MDNSNATLIHELAGAVENKRLDSIGKLFTADATYNDIAFGSYSTRLHVVKFIQSWFDEADNFTWRFFDLVCDQQKAYAHYYMRYDLTSRRMQGKQIEVTAFSFFRFKDRGIDYYDERLNLASPLLGMELSPKVLLYKLRQRAKWDAENVQEAKQYLEKEY